MKKAALKKLVRNFPENGPKLLLENAASMQELLVLLHEPQVGAIDFTKLTVERSHFVQPDYAHVALDLLLKAPFRVGAGAQTRTIFIYLLVEHQSKPQRFFLLRLAEYLLEVYKSQKLAWDKQHSSDAKFLLQPVLPIVLYTGERRWEKIDKLVDVIDGGELFAEMIPTFRPHFLNLRDTSPQQLVQEGGFFGQMLRLIQARHADKAVFRQTLAEVVSQLDKMPEAERTRWSEFLHYIQALVYHVRSGEEQVELLEVVDRSIVTDSHRQEYANMGRTIAEMYVEKGRQEGELKTTKTILLRQLRQRFKKVPRKVAAHIADTTELQKLYTWLDNIFIAKTLAEVGIPLD